MNRDTATRSKNSTKEICSIIYEEMQHNLSLNSFIDQVRQIK